MQKLTELHQHIIQELRPLEIIPESVKAFADEGSITFYQGDVNDNFKMSYNATITLFETQITAGQVAYVVTKWIKENIPHSEEPIKFTAEILDAQSWDIVLSLKIDEYIVAQDIEGDINLARSEDANFRDSIDATLDIDSIHDPAGPPA